ncbi:hypothetical protein EVAR_68900_1 [Eumeta japonica]|uniref:Uncharacterized protein n=1 Tax=Eumeta variegata TaxID=151549 RepID=A0A4C1ZUS5_EUMVA|nr:hypothetical protein EVAR_68900_1 [Eumeta japonica]
MYYPYLGLLELFEENFGYDWFWGPMMELEVRLSVNVFHTLTTNAEGHWTSIAEQPILSVLGFGGISVLLLSKALPCMRSTEDSLEPNMTIFDNTHKSIRHRYCAGAGGEGPRSRVASHVSKTCAGDESRISRANTALRSVAYCFLIRGGAHGENFSIRTRIGIGEIK